jgi:hypothetical protein
MSIDLATWEDENEVKAKYLGAPAWEDKWLVKKGVVRRLNTNTQYLTSYMTGRHRMSYRKSVCCSWAKKRPRKRAWVQL